MIYVTSDLHGYSLDKFLDFLNRVGFCDDDTLYILGDIIDRGADGIKLLSWSALQPNVELILGNHEDMLLKSGLPDSIIADSVYKPSYKESRVYNAWISNGGQITVDSLYATNKCVLLYIMDYLKEAPLYKSITVGKRKFILTHSGLSHFRQDKPIEAYSSSDLLWNRSDTNTRYFDNGTIVIFGHTPTVCMREESLGQILKTDTWINVDVGISLQQEVALLRLDDMHEFYYKDYINKGD